jgi:hypothetical protein
VFPVAAPPATIAQRRETELTERYRKVLEYDGRTVFRWRITPPAQLQSLLTDLYHDVSNELYEVSARFRHGPRSASLARGCV